jgi:hypothetical protein
LRQLSLASESTFAHAGRTKYLPGRTVRDGRPPIRRHCLTVPPIRLAVCFLVLWLTGCGDGEAKTQSDVGNAQSPAVTKDTDLRGLSFAEADRHLWLSWIRIQGRGQLEDSVICDQQNPTLPDEPIAVAIADVCPTIPDLRGKTLGEAVMLLRQQGVYYGVVDGTREQYGDSESTVEPPLTSFVCEGGFDNISNALAGLNGNIATGIYYAEGDSVGVTLHVAAREQKCFNYVP